MTELQQAYLTLREQGRTIKEIAAITHRSPSSVSAALQRAKAQQSDAPREKGKRCKYSDSCFECPQKDCTVGAADVNLLPEVLSYLTTENRKGANPT